MGFCVWLTGIPASGKTTLALELQKQLQDNMGLRSSLLDGDEVRENVTKGLGFSPEDREENVLRVGWMARKITEAGGIALVSMVSPSVGVRNRVRETIPRFFEVWVRCSTSKAIQRDPKGLYKKAAAGEIPNLTGFNAPYAPPVAPEFIADHEEEDYDTAIAARGIIAEMKRRAWISVSKAALFIGRWSPFHNGHKYIIDQKIEQGIPVCIGVRRTHVSEFNPWSVGERIDMIRAVYPNAYVFPMPDIESVNIGRQVGYEVNRFEVPDDIEGISATGIRKGITAGEDNWKSRVPPQVAEAIAALGARCS